MLIVYMLPSFLYWILDFWLDATCLEWILWLNCSACNTIIMSNKGDALQENLQTSGVRECPKKRREGETCKEGCCECLHPYFKKHGQICTFSCNQQVSATYLLVRGNGICCGLSDVDLMIITCASYSSDGRSEESSRDWVWAHFWSG